MKALLLTHRCFINPPAGDFTESESQKTDQIARLLPKIGAGLGLYGSDLSKRSDPSNNFMSLFGKGFLQNTMKQKNQSELQSGK